MAETVKVVIRIPKKCKEFLDNGGKVDWLDAIPIIDAIANGTLLPKGHGRLIDADDLKTTFQNHHDFFIMAYGSPEKFRRLATGDKIRVDEILTGIAEIVNAPTIIKTDKEEQT